MFKRHWKKILAVLVTLALLAGGIAWGVHNDSFYSKQITTGDYLNELGIRHQAPYPLVANPETGQAATQGSLDASGFTFLGVGSFEMHGNVMTVQEVRFAVNFGDQTAIIDYPMGKIAWKQEAGASPTAAFYLDPSHYWYNSGIRGESLWERNPNGNTEKDRAILEFNKSPAELIAKYSTKVTITVTPDVFKNEVLPLQRGKLG